MHEPQKGTRPLVHRREQDNYKIIPNKTYMPKGKMPEYETLLRVNVFLKRNSPISSLIGKFNISWTRDQPIFCKNFEERSRLLKKGQTRMVKGNSFQLETIEFKIQAL